MKKYAMLALLLCCTLSTLRAEIEFAEVTTNEEWQSTLDQAGKEGKLIFVDVYTDWCGWCVKMEKDIYSQDVVSEYYNANFINVKLNAEKGDGPSIMKNYEIGGYPAYLFVDSKGSAVRTSGGYQQAEDFKALGEGAVVIFEKLPAMKESFSKGNMPLEDMAEFADIASDLGDQELLDKVVGEYYQKVGKKERFSRTSFRVLKHAASNMDSEAFQFLLTNKDKYIEAVGDQAFTEAIKVAYMSGIEATMETKDYSKLKKIVDKLTPLLVETPEEAPVLAYQTELYVYKSLQDWSAYKACFKSYTEKTGGNKAFVYRDAADLIGRDFNIDNPELLKDALGWAQKAVEIEKTFAALFTRSIMEIRHDELRDALATLSEAEKITEDQAELAQLGKLKEMLEAQIQQQED